MYCLKILPARATCRPFRPLRHAFMNRINRVEKLKRVAVGVSKMKDGSYRHTSRSGIESNGLRVFLSRSSSLDEAGNNPQTLFSEIKLRVELGEEQHLETVFSVVERSHAL